MPMASERKNADGAVSWNKRINEIVVRNRHNEQAECKTGPLLALQTPLLWSTRWDLLILNGGESVFEWGELEKNIAKKIPLWLIHHVSQNKPCLSA